MDLSWTNAGCLLEHGPDNVLIEGDTFKDISSGTSSAKAILSGDSNTTDAATGLKIRANTFSNISALRGAYGVILNNGAGNPGAIIEANAFNGLSGAWTHAIGLEGPTENQYENNAFAGLTATSAIILLSSSKIIAKVDLLLLSIISSSIVA